MQKSLLFTVLLAIGLASPLARANDFAGHSKCCAHCKRQVACVQKSCQVVCETKKETKYYWSVECKEICPLLPGHRDCDSCCPPPPRCGEPRCVKKLVKNEYQVDVPVYKCVVKYLCGECCNNAATPSQPQSQPTAPVPTVAPPSKGVPPLPKAPEVPPTPPIPSATPKPSQSAAILPSLQ
jgi:hypothetical protein